MNGLRAHHLLSYVFVWLLVGWQSEVLDQAHHRGWDFPFANVSELLWIGI
jgi:hypothetical protein